MVIVGKHNMSVISAPKMGVYRVQNCPDCKCVPCIDAEVKKKETAVDVEYEINAGVYCPLCGLYAPSVETWNKLRIDDAANVHNQKSNGVVSPLWCDNQTTDETKQVVLCKN